MEVIRKSLRESKAARWTALVIISLTVFAGYYIADVMAPLKGLLEQQISWNSAQYGFFTSAYGWFNVFLLMLIFGGIMLDKLGIRITGITAAGIMVIGTLIKYWAISTHQLDGVTWHILWFDTNAQVFMAAIGYAIFGVGVEVIGITATKAVFKWFKGKELALAMGLQVSIARLGTALAIGISLPIANILDNVSSPVLLGLVLLIIGFLLYIYYAILDRKLDRSEEGALVDEEEEESFKMSDIRYIISNRAWWYIAFLCVLFYSAVFPFLKFATDLMIQKFHVTENLAGFIPALLPFGTILLTPLFGGIYDNKGKGATIMIIGSFLLIFVHGLFALPILNHWIIAIILMIILGISFSLVPSAMWPAVTKIIPEKYLGTSYGLIFWIQNWGLMGVPALIGWVLQKYCITGYIMVEGKEVATYDYTIPMIIFALFGVVAVLVGYLLKAEDRKKGYGLELPNIESK